MRAVVVFLLALFAIGCGGEEKSRSSKEPKPKASPTVVADEAAATDEPTVCQASPKDSLTVRAKFEPGQTRVVEVVKKRVEKGQEQEGRSTAKLEVLGPRRLRWTAEDVVLAPGIPAQDFVMEYAIDRDGAYVALKNLDEVRAVTRRVVERLDKETAGVPAAARKRIRSLLLSDAFIQNALTQDISTLHGVYGVHLKENEKITAPTEVPNPFGGRPFPARARIENGGQDDYGCALLGVRVVPDPAALQRSVEEGLEGVLPGQAKFPRNLKLVNIAEYVYDEGSGWMTRVESIKDMRSGRMKRADHTTLILREG